MEAQKRPLGTILLAGVLLTASVAGIFVLGAAFPRNSNTSPLLALVALAWSCACIVSAILTWRRSRYAGLAFLAPVGMLLLPASFLVPGGQLFLPSLGMIILIASLICRYLYKVREPG